MEKKDSAINDSGVIHGDAMNMIMKSNNPMASAFSSTKEQKEVIIKPRFRNPEKNF